MCPPLTFQSATLIMRSQKPAYVMRMYRLYAWRSVVSRLHLGGSRASLCRTEQHHLHPVRGTRQPHLDVCECNVPSSHHCHLGLARAVPWRRLLIPLKVVPPRGHAASGAQLSCPLHTSRHLVCSQSHGQLAPPPHRLLAALCSAESRTSHPACSMSAPASRTCKMPFQYIILAEELTVRLWATDSALSSAAWLARQTPPT